VTSTDNDPTHVFLLGHPIGHSLSPLMHNAAFMHDGLNMRYVAHDVVPEGLPEAVEGLRRHTVRGANLTLPHKERVLPLLDHVEGDALSLGAVNTIVNHEGRLSGHNTDLAGFRGALRLLVPGGAIGSNCLVLGAGGAARAVVAGLMGDGASRVWVANRNEQRARTLCAEAVEWGGAACVPLGLHQVAAVVDECDIIVNATSLGLPDSVKEFPLDVDSFHSEQVLMDLVYGTQPTALVRAARDKGLRALDGKEMLVQQAALSYRLWTGLEAPLEIMRGALIGC
jgi:shikimate dehydrogenase